MLPHITLNPLFQKKMLVILLLGFASGLPLGLTGATLQAWYTVADVDLATIGLLALIGQPYVYKFMWAPLMDRFHPGPIQLGKRRGWMLITQLGLLLSIGLMATLEPQTQPYLLALVGLMVAILSATQDIVIDAYRTEILTPQEHGLGAAMAVSGYRIAMLCSGGLTLIVASYIGFPMTYISIALLLLLGSLGVLIAQEPTGYRVIPLNFKAAFTEPFIDFLQRKHAWALLALVILYKLGDAFAGSLTLTFLIREVGFSLATMGILNKSVGLCSTLLGVFCGGFLLTKLNLFQALLWFGVIQALTNLSYLALNLVGANYFLLGTAVSLENFGGGLGTAAFMALMMRLCTPGLAATQFALLSALSAIGRVFIGPIAGVLAAKGGWSAFFMWSQLFALPGVILLIYLKRCFDAPLAESRYAAILPSQ
jgi:PAT family beta-lactamase induction signal transducer AmpG